MADQGGGSLVDFLHQRLLALSPIHIKEHERVRMLHFFRLLCAKVVVQSARMCYDIWKIVDLMGRID